MIRAAQIVLAIAGFVLLSINAVGLFVPLRNPEIYDESNTCFERDITLSEEEFLRNEEEASTLETPNYFETLTGLVRSGMACYWEDSGISRYNLRIPIEENYLLFAASHLRPRNYRKYQFCDYRKALERGIGACSQHAIVLNGFLNQRGYESKIVGLDGHIVVTAKIDSGQWWILDGHYGVVMKHSLEEIEEDPDQVRSYYLAAGASRSMADAMVMTYSAAGNVSFAGINEYFRSDRCAKEKATYGLIWLIPSGALILVPLLSFFRVRPQGDTTRMDV